MQEDFLKRLLRAHQQAASCCAPPHLVVRFFKRLIGLLFAEFSEQEFLNLEEIQNYENDLRTDFRYLLERSTIPQRSSINNVCDTFFDELPLFRQTLEADAKAIYAGDPAAKSLTEVIRTYPGFYAVAAHRVANCIHRAGITLMPRVISEHAHSKTGVDIHPGAQIGQNFCIDHGTGIVIGETCIIGNDVKIYQGVTLGALSVRKEDAAKKRHPTIQDRVVIYAGATILGGKTLIGHDSTIGGNVWLTDSVPPFSKIYYRSNKDLQAIL